MTGFDAQPALRAIEEKMPFSVAIARKEGGIPYTIRNGVWQAKSINWWTNGFWPATMWQMYLQTGDALYRAEAIRCELLLDKALAKPLSLHHDVGFMWLPSSGVHYALEKEQDSLERLLLCAQLLCGRFNPNGFLRAWNGDGTQGWSIIDSMMNLPLLYHASELTGDDRYMLTARAHAQKTCRCAQRKDGSFPHIIEYDTRTGAVKGYPVGQGYAPEGCWTRGLAWGIYGFSLSYIYTKDEEFLTCAMRAADYLLSHMPSDALLPVDFIQPAEPHVMDACANAIAASGLLELAELTDKADAMRYQEAALALLSALFEHCFDNSTRTCALLTRCTEKYHDRNGWHIAMTYGDYFYIEALRKIAGDRRLFWKPLRTAKDV